MADGRGRFSQHGGDCYVMDLPLGDYYCGGDNNNRLQFQQWRIPRPWTVGTTVVDRSCRFGRIMLRRAQAVGDPRAWTEA
mmetsp:Transcript_30788/g.57702  ORF Transcript_30788/g.57702 Transcript_30788/m.57702 type:complete len:80 (+) Transcript_30788:1747-1986(+)